MRSLRFRQEYVLILGFVLVVASLVGLTRLAGPSTGSVAATPTAATPSQVGGAGAPEAAATPVAGRSHVVQRGETLAGIAARYNVPIRAIIDANGLADPNLVQAGQTLIIPLPGVATAVVGAATLIIPDNELVYGPSGRDFSIDQATPPDGYLRRYSDTVEGVVLTGIEIVQLAADRTRVHPRLLLAALEFQSGWVSQPDPAQKEWPLGLRRPGVTGLYAQLEWAANQFNRGYYGRSEGGLTGFRLGDGREPAFDPAINHGTAGAQQWLAARSGSTFADWQTAAGPNGLRATYERLFGDPFRAENAPVWAERPTQPSLRLPWAKGETWYFTGGPHGGWISGSGWAALDFVPPGEQVGCYESVDWVVAVADGVIARSSFGAVELDLDGDGYAGTGWVILYQHIAARDRVATGTRVRTGDRLGRPSCEGGYSTGTHLHIARLYNGRWVPADQDPAFNLDGWISRGFGSEYNGLLVRNGVTRVADAARLPANAITADQ